MQDDQDKHTERFETGRKGVLPPLVSTDYIADDRGNIFILTLNFLSLLLFRIWMIFNAHKI